MTGVPLQSAIDVRSSAALPALCTCDVSSRGAPMTTVWKSSEAGSRLTAGPAAPVAVPLTPRLIVGFSWSLLAMARQAPAGRAPAAVGAKVTLRVTLPPASTVNGAASVQVIEPGVAAQDEMPVTFSGAVPAFCTWAPSVFELPTVTVWKASEAGLSAMAGAAVVVAVPLTPRLMVGFGGSLLAMARQAPAGRAPAAFGANVWLRFGLPPAGTVNGPVGVRVIELGVPAQDETLVTFSGAVPVFCTWVLSVLELPTVTIWKFSEVGLRTMAGAGVFVPVPASPRLRVGFAGSLLARARQAPAGRAPAVVGAKVTLRLALPPAATVNGPGGVRVIELGVPAQDETLVTFSGAVPVFCTWALSVLELPTVTIWKFSEVGLRTMAAAGAFVPVPASPRLRGGFAGSLLARARQAPAGRAPAALGAKVTLRLALPPAATVNGPVGVRVIELGVPAQDETLVTFSGAVPVFCTWVLSVLELPTVTIWKFSEVGLRTMAAAGVFVPVPASPRLRVGFAGSLLAMARQAPAGRAPAAVGAKVTLRLAFAPAATVNDPVGAQVTELGVPGQDDTLVTFSGAVPVFCTWAVRAFGLPTVTVPKLSELGLRAIAGAEAADPLKAGSAMV